MGRLRVLILGAAGRDFHDFNVAFRGDPSVEVVGFTAAQIPNIAGRRYPPELAGKFYPEGIPIFPEDGLESLVERLRVDRAVFAYSDVSHQHVMELASRVLASGAEFALMGPRATALRSRRPVVSVCAVRTGAGKSPAARRIASILRREGLRVGVVRHPMPYGDLARQALQRFASVEDLQEARCTIEEREEYEPHLAMGSVVFAGVDYERILRVAEEDSDVILWDGGNNDTPFFESDLEIVLADPHRAGDERTHFTGLVNMLRADVVVLTKLDTADPGDVERLRRSVRELNPRAAVVDSAMPIAVDDPERIRGRRVLIIEDGPTLTHGGMRFGAGALAADRFGAAERVDPRPAAVGGILDVYAQYPHLGPVLPAMGYGDAQVRDLEETIRRVDCDLVLIATPVDLSRIVRIDRPVCRVRYDLEEIGTPTLGDVLRDVVAGAKKRRA
jgi:predicted GTPase